MRQPVHSPAAAEIHYPSSDGKPMAENNVQRTAMLYGVGALRVHFAGREDVYVSGDLLIYLRGGEPAGVGGAGRVRGVRCAGPDADELQGVGGGEGTGLRAGGGVAGDVA